MKARGRGLFIAWQAIVNPDRFGALIGLWNNEGVTDTDIGIENDCSKSCRDSTICMELANVQVLVGPSHFLLRSSPPSQNRTILHTEENEKVKG